MWFLVLLIANFYYINRSLIWVKNYFLLYFKQIYLLKFCFIFKKSNSFNVADKRTSAASVADEFCGSNPLLLNVDIL